MLSPIHFEQRQRLKLQSVYKSGGYSVSCIGGAGMIRCHLTKGPEAP
jgi:hypothetical protein